MASDHPGKSLQVAVAMAPACQYCPPVLTVLVAMAQVDMGRPQNARSLQERALAVTEAACRLGRAIVAIRLNNLPPEVRLDARAGPLLNVEAG